MSLIKKEKTMTKVDLSSYNNEWYSPGAGTLKRFIWLMVNGIVFSTTIFPFNSVKVLLLKLFGAKIGKQVTIKPNISIKYPWFLEIGDHVWIGENVWIDNLTHVKIGNHCCLSQGAMLLTGNHDFTSSAFDLIVKPIILEEGVWIGAKAVVCPGVTCHDHAVLAVSSVATKNLQSFKIYQGNPAIEIKDRSLLK